MLCWLRTANEPSGLTLAALVVAMFLFCFLISLVTSLKEGVNSAAAHRVITQSAVSLFVELPLDYQSKIEGIDGVEDVTKFQWFGGVYQDPKNFLVQFAVDHDRSVVPASTPAP